MQLPLLPLNAKQDLLAVLANVMARYRTSAMCDKLRHLNFITTVQLAMNGENCELEWAELLLTAIATCELLLVNRSQ